MLSAILLLAAAAVVPAGQAFTHQNTPQEMKRNGSLRTSPYTWWEGVSWLIKTLLG